MNTYASHPGQLPRRQHDEISRRRLLACFWAVARKHGVSDAKLSEIVSLELGERVVVGSGFGLSRLTVEQLIRAVDVVKRFVGQEPGQMKRRAASREPRAASRERRGNVITLATPDQVAHIERYQEAIFGFAPAGCAAFAVFCERMTGRATMRGLTDRGAFRLIEAMKSMQARGWRPAAAASTVQGPRSEVGDVGHRTGDRGQP